MRVVKENIGHDKRIVSYEKLHGLTNKEIGMFINAVNPKAGEKILDACCGYGSAGKALLMAEKQSEVYFLDESKTQIDRAKTELREMSGTHFKVGSIQALDYENEVFDKIVVKMGLHEIPKDEQIIALKEARRVLKPKGELIVWDVVLGEDNQRMFQEIVRMKDRLADFRILEGLRYFFTETEFLEAAKKAGFEKISNVQIVPFRFSTEIRLVSELHGNLDKLKKLNSFIRSVFPESLRSMFNYMDNGNDISFDVLNKIYTVQK